MSMGLQAEQSTWTLSKPKLIETQSYSYSYYPNGTTNGPSTVKRKALVSKDYNALPRLEGLPPVCCCHSEGRVCTCSTSVSVCERRGDGELFATMPPLLPATEVSNEAPLVSHLLRHDIRA